MTACTHGHEADPKLCPVCKGAGGHIDPDIQAAWKDARDALALMLRPYVQAHLIDELAKRYVDGLEHHGWRPPLRPPRPIQRLEPDQVRAATDRGAELARQALTHQDSP